MIFHKVYERKNGYMIAACDEKLVGKTLGKDKFFVNPRFYGNEKISKKDLMIFLKKCVIANLVGKESVDAGIEAGIISKEHIVMVGKEPHAQFILMTI